MEIPTTNLEQERNLYIKKIVKIIPIIFDEFLKELPPIVKSNGNLYIYNPSSGIYELFSIELFDKKWAFFIKTHEIESEWKINRLNELWRFAKTYEFNEVELDDNDNYIPVNNGIVDILNKEILPYSPNFYFTSKIDIDYDPNNKIIDNFLLFLNSTFNNDIDLVNLIIEVGSYLIFPGNKANKMFIFYGASQSGKSTLLNTFQMFFRKNQITSISAVELAETKGFGRAGLINSRVNIVSEEKDAYLGSEELKKIISGELIAINDKGEKVIFIKPKTKIIFACNSLPSFKEYTDAITRRMIIFNFPNIYLPKSEFEMQENPGIHGVFLRDDELEEKIQKEKGAIFNLFLEYYQELKKKRFNFKEVEKTLEAKEEYKRDSDSIREFLEDNYLYEEDKVESIDDIYKKLQVWYSENVGGKMKLRKNELGRRICNIYKIKSFRKWDEKRTKKNYFYNLKFTGIDYI